MGAKPNPSPFTPEQTTALKAMISQTFSEVIPSILTRLEPRPQTPPSQPQTGDPGYDKLTRQIESSLVILNKLKDNPNTGFDRIVNNVGDLAALNMIFKIRDSRELTELKIQGEKIAQVSQIANAFK